MDYWDRDRHDYFLSIHIIISVILPSNFFSYSRVCA